MKVRSTFVKEVDVFRAVVLRVIVMNMPLIMISRFEHYHVLVVKALAHAVRWINGTGYIVVCIG